jgi:hypothetical protein
MLRCSRASVSLEAPHMLKEPFEVLLRRAPQGEECESTYFTKLRRTGNVFTLAGGTSSTRRGVASGPRLSR